MKVNAEIINGRELRVQVTFSDGNVITASEDMGLIRAGMPSASEVGTYIRALNLAISNCVWMKAHVKTD